MTARRTNKVRFRASSARWLNWIDRHIRACNIRGPLSRFTDVAADALDGHVTKKDLSDLIKRRLLVVVRYGYDDSEKWGPDPMRRMDPELCGTCWSVNPTERLIRALWPDRLRRANR